MSAKAMRTRSRIRKAPTVKQALQSASNAISLVANSMKSVGRIAQRESEAPPAGEEDLLNLYKYWRIMKAVSELLGSVEGCDLDSADEINREFGIIRQVLDDNSYLDGPPSRPDEY